MNPSRLSTLSMAIWLVTGAAACAAGTGDDADGQDGPSTGGRDSSGAGASTGEFMDEGGGGAGSNPQSGGDPKTCEEAREAKTYLGCDFWPTVTANNVWSIFDFAAVVANAGNQPAEVTVTRNGSTISTVTVPANGLQTVFLPWVPELKGPDADACGSATPLTASVRSTGGAYHLVSSLPVTVYQFNALEYGAQGGPPGKDWSACPATQCGLECFSYWNDASLLLPSTAQTTNYRVLGFPGWSIPGLPSGGLGATLTVTAFEPGTSVTVTLGAAGGIMAGAGIPSVNGGGQVTFELGEGDVVELVGLPTSDFSGSLVQSTKPIQVLHGLPCRNVPDAYGACDHIEESVVPAETLGQHYVVAMPTGPNGTPVQHNVRLYGNVDGTTLTYPSGAPPFAPTSISAGQVVDLGLVAQNFEVEADHEFGVSTTLLGAGLINPTGMSGDPSYSVLSAVEQFRTKYVFLAPMDYDQNFVDVVMPMGATITLDGNPIPTTAQPVSSGFGIAHVPLSDINGGAHLMVSDQPFGIQVLGYGSYTSYQYPGGLNLDLIAPPPPPPQ